MLIRELPQPPPWASEPEIEVSPEFESAQRSALKRQRDKVMAAVHQAVSEFLADPEQVAVSEEDGFPSADRLSGEYYVSDERYWVVDEPWFKKVGRARQYSFSIELRCLEKPSGENDDDRDYLGLTFNFVWYPEGERFELDGVEPSVI